MYSLDTLNTARALEAAGFAPKQAEALVTAISRADEQLATKNDIAQLATKDDIAQLATKAEVQEIRSHIVQLATKDEVAKVKDEVVKVKENIAWLRADAAARRSEVRLLFGFQSAIILAMAARMFALI